MSTLMSQDQAYPSSPVTTSGHKESLISTGNMVQRPSTAGTAEGSFVGAFDITAVKPSWAYMIKLAIYCGLSSMQLAPGLSATNTAWDAI